MSAPILPLVPALDAAYARREAMCARLLAEGTDAYRLFHGSAEDFAGLTVDRYGDALLVQTFHRALAAAEESALRAYYAERLPGLPLFYNDRSQTNSRIRNALSAQELEEAEAPRTFRELGLRYHFRARHEGQDPWLFLDLRAGRRRVMQEAAGKTVLNLFAYTCGVGLATAKGGAKLVVNVDFSESALRVGRANAKLNDLATRPRCIQSDVFAALRQYSGLGQPKVVRGRRLPPFPELQAQRFDLVFLDPPRYAKSPFGVVDIVNDYPALFKPALLSTTEGGSLICCNNAAQVSAEAWLDQLDRSARKAGRSIRAAEWIAPEEDFPSFDGAPPLKILLLQV